MVTRRGVPSRVTRAARGVRARTRGAPILDPTGATWCFCRVSLTIRISATLSDNPDLGHALDHACTCVAGTAAVKLTGEEASTVTPPRTRWPWMPYAMIAACLAVIILTPIILVFGEQVPLYYVNSPFPALKSPVKPGDTLPLLIERCNRTNQPVIYNFMRTMIPVDDPELLPVAMTPAGTLLPPGCEKVDSQLNPIPMFTPSGRYYIKGVTVVQGRWRTFTVEWSTEPFDVE